MDIFLQNTGKWQWENINGNYVKGFAFIDDACYEGKKLYYIVSEAIDNNTLKELLLKLNGNFSIVIRKAEVYYLITDKIRSFPLFYVKMNNSWLITDQTAIITGKISEICINEIAVAEFLSQGYLSGSKTLIKNCFIVTPGSFVNIRQEANIEYYHSFIVPKRQRTAKQIGEEAAEIIRAAFKRMLSTIRDKTLLIPLSGGYDSRLILCLCKEYNLSNVICYTYGRKDSFEVMISQKVAERLNYPWYFVEYTFDKITQMLHDERYIKYIRCAGNFNTRAHAQDYIAISELLSKGIIDKDTVVIPGHSGDMLGGSHVSNAYLNYDNYCDIIYDKYFTLNILKKRYELEIRNNISNYFALPLYKDRSSNKLDYFNEWGIKVRQVNFIINSVRLYEYFGLGWRVPLWDDDFVDFWNSVEWKFKLNKAYDDFLFDHFFTSYHVDYRKKKLNNNISFFKRIVPREWKSTLRNGFIFRLLFKSNYDVNGLQYVIQNFTQYPLKRDYSCIKKYKFDIESLNVLHDLFLLRNR